MRIAYLIAGAGGMYCGSCIRDNRLAATLIRQGRDVQLIPLYTPIRTDETDVSTPQVFYGGVNVYLQQKSSLFRRGPRVLDRLLDSPRMLRTAGRLASRTRAEKLGDLTVSVLEGAHGKQRKELDKLIAALRQIEPTLINLPNLMFIGVTRALKEALGVPVLCTLAGEDIFLDALPEPFRQRARDLIAEAASFADGFLAPTDYYAAYAGAQFSLPADRLHVVRLGICADDFAPPPVRPPAEPFTIGYLARVCPEKGIDNLADAVIALHQAGRQVRLRIAGYLGAADVPYWRKVEAKLRSQLPAGAFDFAGEVSRAEKIAFLHSLHALSVPTSYAEAKGLYLLEAMAAGVPVIQPRHGSFPELIEATGGGLLYDADRPEALVDAIAGLMDDPRMRERLAEMGCASVRKVFTDEVMAGTTWTIYERYHGSRG